MWMRIDPSDGVPIYDQIVRQVTFAVADGLLRPGELVPSVRELSRQLTVNPNTVARAYRQLQDEHVLRPVRGTGLAVAQGAAARCRKKRAALIRQRLQQFLNEARRSGLEKSELASWIETEMARVYNAEART